MKDNDKKDIHDLFKAVKYLTDLIELLAFDFDSDQIKSLIKKVRKIHEDTSNE